MVFVAVTAAVLPGASPAVSAAEAGSVASRAGALMLSAPQGSLDARGAGPVLRFSALLTSTLPAGVTAVDVGVLFAAEERDLAGVDAGALYRRGEIGGGQRVGVVLERAAVVVPPGGAVRIEVVRPLPAGAPEARAFAAHVLGYELADATASLLFDLLSTRSAADEVAAVRAVGLDRDGAQRLAVRRRWSGRAARIVDGLVAELEAPAPERPGEGDTFRRVYAALALGALGGEACERALGRLARDPGLARFDEPLQVLRIARAVGSSLETPLAYALPAQAQRMADVVAAAFADCRGLEGAGEREGDEVDGGATRRDGGDGVDPGGGPAPARVPENGATSAASARTTGVIAAVAAVAADMEPAAGELPADGGNAGVAPWILLAAGAAGGAGLVGLVVAGRRRWRRRGGSAAAGRAREGATHENG